jgi:hypothetical protein
VLGSGRRLSKKRQGHNTVRAIANEIPTVVEEPACLVEERGMKCSMERTLDFFATAESSNPMDLAMLTPETLEEAYTKCGIVTEHYAKTFYLGTQIMTPEKARAIWAIYVWQANGRARGRSPRLADHTQGAGAVGGAP